MQRCLRRSCLTWMPPTIPCTGIRRGAFHCYYATCCYLPLYVFCGRYGAARTSSGRPCGKANPRFVVISLKPEDVRVRRLYETLYCARGKMENRIRECQLGLFADRSSSCSMRTNQLRLWFAFMAYVLLCALRRIGLAQTRLVRAGCRSIWLKLLEIAALVRISVRWIKFHHNLGPAIPERIQSWGIICIAMHFLSIALVSLRFWVFLTSACAAPEQVSRVSRL